MKSPKLGKYGKIALLGGAGLVAVSLAGKSGLFDRSGGEGAIGGTDDLGGGALAEETPVYVQENNYYTNQEPMTQDVPLPQAVTQAVPTFQDLAVVNRNIMFDNGLADSGQSVEWGEVFYKDGKVVGGTDVISGQSLTPQGVADREAKANNPFLNWTAPEQLMSVDPNAVANAGNQSVGTSPFNTVAEVGLAGATLIPSPATKFGENLFSTSLDTSKNIAKPVAKEVGSEVAESGLRAGLKYAGRQGAKAIPFVGLGAGITMDSTGALGGKQYPVGVAIAGNVLGDILGGVGATLSSPLAVTGIGATVPVAVGIGGQIAGEQIIYAPYNKWFRKDEDEVDELETQTAYAEPPSLLMSPSAINQVTSSSKKRSSSSGSKNNAPLQPVASPISGTVIEPKKSSSSRSSSSSSRSSSSKKSSSSSSSSKSSSSSSINTSRFTANKSGGYSDNVAKQSVSKSVAQSRSKSYSSYSSYSKPKTSSLSSSRSSSSKVSTPKKTTPVKRSFTSRIRTRVSSFFKRK